MFELTRIGGQWFYPSRRLLQCADSVFNSNGDLFGTIHCWDRLGNIKGEGLLRLIGWDKVDGIKGCSVHLAPRFQQVIWLDTNNFVVTHVFLPEEEYRFYRFGYELEKNAESNTD